MEKYNVFKLFVVENDNISYICQKVNENYIDIFFKEEIEVENNDDVKYLASYYMVETMKKIAKGEEFYLSKKDLLIMFANLNAHKIEKDKDQSHPYAFLSYQENYLKAFKELSENRPDIAKMIAEEKIKKLNLRNDD